MERVLCGPAKRIRGGAWDRPKAQAPNLTLVRSGRLVCWHLEHAPEIVAGQLQSQVLVGTTTPTLPFTKRSTVPVQPLQVQQTRRHRAMTRLMHPQHAVHALD